MLETAIAWEPRCTATLRIINPFTMHHPPVDNRLSLTSFTTLSLSTSILALTHASLLRSTQYLQQLQHEPLIRRPPPPVQR